MNVIHRSRMLDLLVRMVEGRGLPSSDSLCENGILSDLFNAYGAVSIHARFSTSYLNNILATLYAIIIFKCRGTTRLNVIWYEYFSLVSSRWATNIFRSEVIIFISVRIRLMHTSNSKRSIFCLSISKNSLFNS
jgi:hypothetical protein